MAAIPVTFQGILFFSDLGVGGGPMPGGPFPSHPIAPGGQPPGYWGGVAPPYVDIGFPGPQPPPGQPTHPIYWPPQPSHPIYNPGGPPGSSPPGFWGGGMGPGVKPQPPWPGQPPQPPLGIWGGPYWPPVPTHPIVLPPITPGGPPVTIWPSPPEGQAPIPSHPIVVPPLPPPPDMEGGGKPPPPEGGWGFHPEFGWGYFPGGGATPGPK